MRVTVNYGYGVGGHNAQKVIDAVTDMDETRAFFVVKNYSETFQFPLKNIIDIVVEHHPKPETK